MNSSKTIISAITIVLLLGFSTTAAAKTTNHNESSNMEDTIGGGFLTGVKVSEFAGTWSLSPGIGGQLLLPKYHVLFTPIFHFGSLTLKPGDTVVKKASHFSFTFLFGFYVVKSKRFDLALQFGPGYLENIITTEDGEIVKKEKSGANITVGAMMKLGKFIHVDIGISTNSFDEGMAEDIVESVFAMIGYSWLAK